MANATQPTVTLSFSKEILSGTLRGLVIPQTLRFPSVREANAWVASVSGRVIKTSANGPSWQLAPSYSVGPA